MIQYLVPFYQNFLIKYMYKVLHSRFVLSWLHLSSKGLAIASSVNFSFPRYHQQCIINGIVLTCMCYVWYAIYRFCILWSLNELCLKINLSSLLHTDGSWGQWLGIECLIYRLGLSLYRFIWWDVRYIYIYVLHTYIHVYIYTYWNVLCICKQTYVICKSRYYSKLHVPLQHIICVYMDQTRSEFQQLLSCPCDT